MDRKLIEYNSRVCARVERLSSTIDSLLIDRMKTMARYFMDKGTRSITSGLIALAGTRAAWVKLL